MMNEKQSQTLEKWHAFVKHPDRAVLEEILAAEAIFLSPFLFKAKSKDFSVFALAAAATVFEDFHYTREFFAENSCCLEFAAHIGDVALEGVDLIKMDEAGQITEFKVMIRPHKGLQALVAEMTKRFEAANFPVV